MNVATAIVDIQVICRRIVADGISVLQEFYARSKLVRCAIEDLQVARVSIRYVNAVQIFPLEPRVWFADSIYLVHQLAGIKTKNNARAVPFRGRDSPPAFQANSEEVDGSFHC